MPMTWNDQSDAKLLVAILHTTSAKLDYAAIAKFMGPECTKVAVQTRIARLKRQVHDASNPAAAAAAAADRGSAPATPEKRKKGAKTGAKEGGVKEKPVKKVKREEDEEAMETETETEESG